MHPDIHTGVAMSYQYNLTTAIIVENLKRGVNVSMTHFSEYSVSSFTFPSLSLEPHQSKKGK